VTASGVCVLGGSFDPPHETHARIARACLAHLPIDRVLVVPAAQNPHKRRAETAPARVRLRLCELAFAGVPGVEVSDVEVERGAPSYTVDTLRALRDQLPAGAQLYFVIGADNLRKLPTWHRHHEALALAQFVVAPRAGSPVTAAALAGLDLTADEVRGLLSHVLPLTGDSVSASAIRARLRRGEPAGGDVAPAVAAEIARLGLYRPECPPGC
jgi:nicotinate-nucleotide adenylyltransferase